MTNKNTIFLGSGLLVFAQFVPFLSLPIVGTVTLFSSGGNLISYLFIGLAGAAAFLAHGDKEHDSFFPGIASAALVLALFAGLQIKMAAAKEQMAQQLEGNPFAGMASSFANAVQMQWGWVIVAAGAITIVVGAWRTRKESEITVKPDNRAKFGSLAAFVVGIAWMVFQSGFIDSGNSGETVTETTPIGAGSLEGASALSVEPNADEADYISKNVEVYDLSASYQDSLIDGRVPGVDFKVKNKVDRSLSKVNVTVVFFDSEGNAIAEDTFYPVLVTTYDSDPPLRPGYIWQQERGRFYAAKSVPDEWQPGKVSAKVTEIEFTEAE